MRRVEQYERYFAINTLEILHLPHTTPSFPVTCSGIVLSATSLTTPGSSPFLEPVEATGELESLRTSWEGITTTRTAKRGSPLFSYHTWTTTRYSVGKYLSIFGLSYKTARQQGFIHTHRKDQTRVATHRNFPNDLVLKVSQISCRFFFEKLGS